MQKNKTKQKKSKSKEFLNGIEYITQRILVCMYTIMFHVLIPNWLSVKRTS